MRNYLKCARTGARTSFHFFEDSDPRERERIRDIAAVFLIDNPDGLASVWRAAPNLVDLHVIGMSVEVVDEPAAEDPNARHRAAERCRNCLQEIGFGRRYYLRDEGGIPAHVAC